jgi:hypothetical protein
VTADQAAAAIERISDRRRHIDDPNAWRLSDDPAEVLDYIRRYSAGVPAWVAEADVLDGLELRLRLWWLGEVAELWLLEQAQRLGVPPRRVGARLGVSSRQGVHDRLRLGRRKVAVLRGEPRDNRPSGADQQKRDEEGVWLREHRGEILAIAAAALEYTDLADEEAAEWLAEVARDLREDVVSPGSVQLVRFALLDLSSSAAVRQLDEDHPLQQTLIRWSGLYSSYPEPSR